MHQRQRQRGVGARAQGDVFVALVGGLAAARVDADQARAVAFGLLCQAPEVQVAGDRVAAPDDDELRFGEKLDLHADLGAQRGHQAFAARGRTDGALQVRGAQLVEEAGGHAFALHQAHGAGVAVGQDGLRVAGGDGLQACRDVVQRFVPVHRSELAAAFGACAFERLQDALGVVAAFGVARNLGAQRTIGVPVRRVALHPQGHAVVDRGQQGAGVGAVVWTGAAHHGLGRVCRAAAARGRGVDHGCKKMLYAGRPVEHGFCCAETSPKSA
ncbi:hypothetical protein D9M68_699530 [compost metagenome]